MFSDIFIDRPRFAIVVAIVITLAGLIADDKGNLFGTTSVGGAHGGGTVFEVAKTVSGYASTPTIVVSFCSQANP